MKVITIWVSALFLPEKRDAPTMDVKVWEGEKVIGCLAATGMRHPGGQHLFICLGRISMVRWSILLQTGHLSGLSPRYVSLRCNTSKGKALCDPRHLQCPRQWSELSWFYHWDEQEPCDQVHAHFRGTALAYVRCTSFQPCTWEELKVPLMECFQPQDLTATYKTQFMSRRRCQAEGTYSYVEALQQLADLVWPFMQYHFKEEMVADQFLLGMGNCEHSIQVAAHGHRQVEDILWVARLLWPVHKEEKIHTQGHKPSTQAPFIVNECDQSPDTKQFVKNVLAHLGCGPGSSWEVCRWPPTHGPKQVQRGMKLNLPTLHLPVPRPSICDVVSPLLRKVTPVVEMDQHSAIAGKDMYISLRKAHLGVCKR